MPHAPARNHPPATSGPTALRSFWPTGASRLAIHSSRSRFEAPPDSGTRPINDHPLIGQLKKAKGALIRAYVVHVAWFAIMLAFVSLQWAQQGLKASVLLTLLTVPPVLVYTVKVHHLCRAIDPKARTVGWVPVLVTTIALSPFESGLILPAKNLLAANRILKAHDSLAPDSSVTADGSNNSLEPNLLRSSKSA